MLLTQITTLNNWHDSTSQMKCNTRTHSMSTGAQRAGDDLILLGDDFQEKSVVLLGQKKHPKPGTRPADRLNLHSASG